MQFEIDLGLNLGEIFKKISTVLKSKMTFSGLEFFIEKGLKVVLVDENWFESQKKIAEDQEAESWTEKKSNPTALL